MANFTIKTQPISRDKLAQFADDPRLIRLLENLVFDVAVSIPADSTTNRELITEGPPMPVLVLPDIPDDIVGRLHALEARLAAAELRIAESREGPTP